MLGALLAGALLGFAFSCGGGGGVATGGGGGGQSTGGGNFGAGGGCVYPCPECGQCFAPGQRYCESDGGEFYCLPPFESNCGNPWVSTGQPCTPDGGADGGDGGSSGGDV